MANECSHPSEKSSIVGGSKVVKCAVCEAVLRIEDVPRNRRTGKERK